MCCYHMLIFLLFMSYMKTTKATCDIQAVNACLGTFITPSDQNNVDYAAVCRAIGEYRECITPHRRACIDDLTMGSTITALDGSLKSFDSHCNGGTGGGSGAGGGTSDAQTATNAACSIQAVTACMGKYTAPSDPNNFDYAALCRSIGEYRDCIKPLRPVCTNDPNIGSTITAMDDGLKAFDSHCNGGTGGGAGTVTFPAMLINLLALLATVVVLM